jgi:hypothetical protein
MLRAFDPNRGRMFIEKDLFYKHLTPTESYLFSEFNEGKS